MTSRNGDSANTTNFVLIIF